MEPLKILASGHGWLAVEKPAGMSIHNDPGQDLCTHLSAHLQKDADLQAATGLDPENRLSAVHRLDRETSGIVLLAGERPTLRHFAAQFEARKVEKTYTALLHGHLQQSDRHKLWIDWRWSLSKASGGRKDPRGRGSRKACQTLVRPCAHSTHYTLAECRPLSGRKHQIRRHAKLAGHPVVGDHRYGSKRALQFLTTRHNFNRLGLHASRLEIRLPDNSLMIIRSSELPGTIQQLFDQDG